MDRALELNYRSHLPTEKSAQILDFGCGEGRVLQFLANEGFTNFVGVDIDAHTVDRVPQHLKSKTQVITNLHSFVEKHQAHFDFIILKDVIYYFTRDTAAEKLQLILSCLKPGGAALVEVFNGAQLTASYTAAKDLGIQTVYTETSLQQLLTACGLQIVTVFEQRMKFGGPKFWFYRCVQKLYFAIVKLIFILERGVDAQNPKMLGKSLIGLARKS